MPNLKTLQLRIRSVKNTQQITKAMKMVAAAKLRRSQERAEATRPYTVGMTKMLGSLAPAVANNEGAPPLIAGTGREEKVELVVFTADRGLCGGFNSGVIRAVRTRIAELEAKGKQVSLSCVGSKGYEVLKRQYADRIRKHYSGFGKDLSFDRIQEEISMDLLQTFEEGGFDTAFFVYNKFKSAISQELTWQRLMPIEVEEASEADDGQSGSYLFEPSEDELLGSLLPKNVTVQLFSAQVESDASEHGARMTAMDNAVRNAGEMINKLTITYNRTRQAAITTELMEIIGGAESLKG
ncbi:MAG: F0F1 ATP synthase subunit gamma [Magnetococcales bacterium]|nr:F0F1 ATP synthase subunit gamma [Magnetococcales bacterium]